MTTENQTTFDIFMSYNGDSKESVKLLYKKLSEEYKFKVWIDFIQLKNGMLHQQLSNGIANSAIFLCCITKKYAQSDNCIREMTLASECKLPLVVLMFERFEMHELGSVGFIISPLTRFNCYKEPQLFSSWSDKNEIFSKILEVIRENLSSRIKKSIILSRSFTDCKKAFAI